MKQDRPARDNEDDVCEWLTTRDAEEWPHLIPMDGRLHTLSLLCHCGPLVQGWTPDNMGAVFHYLPS